MTPRSPTRLELFSEAACVVLGVTMMFHAVWDYKTAAIAQFAIEFAIGVLLVRPDRVPE